MRAPSKRVTFIIAFLVANFLLFFPFASEAHEELPGPNEGGWRSPEKAGADNPAGADPPAEEAEPSAGDPRGDH